MPDLEPDTVSALEAPEFAPAQFVRWFREVAPYVHAFRGKTFVVAFGGELVQAGALNTLVQDLSLLSALGIRLVLVHGSRPQVNEQLRLKGYTQQFDRGLSPTDAAALECARKPPARSAWTSRPRSARACPTRPCRTRTSGSSRATSSRPAPPACWTAWTTSTPARSARSTWTR